ncbi:hypothetical protein [Longibaculum muris]|uniref:hypothetical protein n=1 Tax=Longibaculum muris TaxID=1796628 RepID=UPI00189E6F25|nr:hypothetical protein [Longibaculum muris]
MSKARKDMITIYMFRNALATLFAAFASFMISLIHYYQCTFAEALQRLFVFDIYTTLYFLLIWLFDYLIFEISKIIYDIYEEKVTFLPCIALLALCGVIFFIPILDLFQYNLCILFLLICLRMVKEMWKRTPELFKWAHHLVDQRKKRPESGLK